MQAQGQEQQLESLIAFNKRKLRRLGLQAKLLNDEPLAKNKKNQKKIRALIKEYTRLLSERRIAKQKVWIEPPKAKKAREEVQNEEAGEVGEVGGGIDEQEQNQEEEIRAEEAPLVDMDPPEFSRAAEFAQMRREQEWAARQERILRKHSQLLTDDQIKQQLEDNRELISMENQKAVEKLTGVLGPWNNSYTISRQLYPDQTNLKAWKDQGPSRHDQIGMKNGWRKPVATALRGRKFISQNPLDSRYPRYDVLRGVLPLENRKYSLFYYNYVES